VPISIFEQKIGGTVRSFPSRGRLHHPVTIRSWEAPMGQATLRVRRGRKTQE